MNRVPWIDRPLVRQRHCSCPVDGEGERERWFIPVRDEYGHVIARQTVLLTNPECPLHGARAEEAPF